MFYLHNIFFTILKKPHSILHILFYNNSSSSPFHISYTSPFSFFFFVHIALLVGNQPAFRNILAMAFMSKSDAPTKSPVNPVQNPSILPRRELLPRDLMPKAPKAMRRLTCWRTSFHHFQESQETTPIHHVGNFRSHGFQIGLFELAFWGLVSSRKIHPRENTKYKRLLVYHVWASLE